MSTRMQQRRGTAAQWISTNNGNGPILAAGEVGYESDTNKFKIGDGVNHWVDLQYFLDEASIGGSLDGFVPTSDLAQPLGVATLDGSGKLLSSQIPNIDEISQDAVASAITAGNGISKEYNDGADTITIALSHDVEITGTLTLSQAPTADLEAATKLYVDNVVSGINFHEAVKAATVEALTASYSNGTSGVGATLTNSGTMAGLVIDGVTLLADDRVLVKDQTDAKQNGVYVVSVVGSPLVNWELVRASDADNSPAGEFKAGDFNLVISGDVNAGYGFVNSTSGAITVGTTNITYAPFNAGKTVVAGTGLWETAPGVIGIDDTVATLSDAQTLTNKGIDFANNSVTMTLAELNASVTDANVATVIGTETLQNKTLTAPEINSATINDGTIAGSALSGVTVTDSTLAGATTLSGSITGGTINANTLELAGVSVATTSDLSTHASDSTNVHGVADMTALATTTYVDTAVSTHSSDTTSVHGIADTEALVTLTGTQTLSGKTIADPTFTGDITLNNTGDFTISSNDNIVLTPGSGKDIKWGTSVIQKRVGNVTDTEIGYLEGVTSAIQTQLDGKAFSSDLSTHASDTTSVHGIADTSLLVTTTGTQTLSNKTLSSPVIEVGSVTVLATESGVGTDYTSTYAHDGVADLSFYKDGATFSAFSVGDTVRVLSEIDSTINSVTWEVLSIDLVLAYLPNITLRATGVADGLFATVSDGVLQKISGSSATISATEISYLDGVTSSIQTQLNEKAPLASPTFTGTTTVNDLEIGGALTFSGTATQINQTDLTLEDPMIYLAEGNTANINDIGFVGAMNDGTYQHVGLVRDASAGTWKLFKGVTDEPTSTVNFGQGSLDDISVGGLTASSITVGDVSNTEFGYLNGVTSAIQTQLDDKAPLESPALTGTPTAPTAAALTNTTQVATTAYVQEDNKVAYVSVSGTSLTVAQSTHMFKTVHCTSNSAVSVSIPTDASDDWPIGTYVNIRQMGTGQITVAAATPAETTVVATDSQFKSRVQYSEIVLEKIAANSWIVVGDTTA
jgi:hypothetical protein